MINFVNCSSSISSTVSVSKSKDLGNQKIQPKNSAIIKYIRLGFVSIILIGINVFVLDPSSMNCLISFLFNAGILALCVASLILIAIGRVDKDLEGHSKKYHSTLWFMLYTLIFVKLLLCIFCYKIIDTIYTIPVIKTYLPDDKFLSMTLCSMPFRDFIVLGLFVFVPVLSLNIILGLVLNGASNEAIEQKNKRREAIEAYVNQIINITNKEQAV